ncbi:MAG: HEPN domain-containing protein [Patescibacteria group bacterium]|nr:HEPN domain-containing protein [Patescibacteria group bacterium]
MNNKDIKNIVEYWRKTAKRDYDTMLSLFKSKRYPESLFFGHIVLEKILKGLVVKEIKTEAPYIHDLARLCKLAKLDFSQEKISFLNKINDFNIRCRYPEYKLKFYKQCTKEYTEKYLDQIVKLYKELCQT